MTESQSRPAERLSGNRLEGGWTVLSQVDLGDDHTGSAFSIGYQARRDDGTLGYLKAFDYIDALASADPAAEMQRIVAGFNAERDILRHCEDRRMSRVVRVLESGATRVDNHLLGTVQYLIFEWADDDVHRRVQSTDPADQIPMVRLAHGAAAAMAQLHTVGIWHQDVKPSNFLIWDGNSDVATKIADLGCAYFAGRPAPHDDDLIPGDVVHAAPEQLYECAVRLAQTNRRQAADVFMLGNLIVFLLVGVPYNGILVSRLDPSLRPNNWGGTFEEILPALIDAHGKVLAALRDALRGDIAEPLCQIVDQLCYPDANLRGDPMARRTGRNPYSLERFIARLDLIHRRASLRAA
jgi:serine/threonine protein kinase